MDIETTMKIDEENLQTKEPIEGDDRMYLSMYARAFDETCAGWTPDTELNFVFLKLKQHYANDLLKLKGYLYLNEVYDLLGMARTKAGNVVGWIYSEENPVGDNYIDFDLYSSHNARILYGENDETMVLDFNVDGMILDSVPNERNTIKMEKRSIHMMNLNLNYDGFEDYLVERRNKLDGVGYKFRFENRYGASVIKHMGSYGHEQDLWEVAILCWNDDGNDFSLAYNTEITDDVIGWQTDDQIRDILRRIKEL